MNEDIRQQVQSIKRSFRLMMDGATAASMRAKGLNYKLNWGATLPRLREMADNLADADLIRGMGTQYLSIVTTFSLGVFCAGAELIGEAG